MANDKTTAAKFDGERVNLNEPYELADWVEKFGASADKIRDAVAKVGTLAKDVKKELRS